MRASSSPTTATVAQRFGAFLERHDLEPGRIIFAMNVAFAAVLALFFAFLVDLNHTYWALLTIPLVMKQQSGVTVWRSFARFVGTMTGAVVGLVFVSFFAQDGLTMIVTITLWILAAGVLARFESGIDAYAYGVAGLTALVVVLDTGASADQALSIAVARTTETTLAIVSGFMIVLVILPQSVVPTLRQGITKARAQVLGIARAAVDDGDGPTTEERKAVGEALREVFTNLRAWRFERAPDRSSLPRLRTQTSRLNHVLMASEMLFFVLRHAVDKSEATSYSDSARRELVNLLDAVPDTQESAEEASTHARRLREFSDTVRRKIEKEPLAEGAPPQLGNAAIWFRMSRLAEAVAELLEAEAAVLDRSRSLDTVPPFKTRYVDLVAALELGARPAIAFFCLALFWIESAWSNGRILALITGALSLLLPTIAPRAMLPAAGKKIAFGYLAMAPIVLLLMVVLPSMQSFFGFAVLIGSVIFILFYMCGTDNLPVAIGGTLMLAIGLQPSNTATYSPLTLFNTVGTLVLMPVAFIASVAILFPNTEARVLRHLQRGTDDLFTRMCGRRISEEDFLGQSIDLQSDYGGDLDPDDRADRQMIERSRAATLAGLEFSALQKHTGRGTSDEAYTQLFKAARSASQKSRDVEPEQESLDLEKVADDARDQIRNVGAWKADSYIFRLAMASEAIAALVSQNRLALPQVGE